jgi:copper chaperone CopZ
MESLTLSVPAMYGDHHVLEVRRLLLALPGIGEVYASSAFKVVEVTYDPAQIEPDTITNTLKVAGYLDELPLPLESGRPVTEADGNGRYFRHTAVYPQADRVVAFAQEVTPPSRPLWPCPGFGPVPKMDE